MTQYAAVCHFELARAQKILASAEISSLLPPFFPSLSPPRRIYFSEEARQRLIPIRFSSGARHHYASLVLLLVYPRFRARSEPRSRARVATRKPAESSIFLAGGEALFRLPFPPRTHILRFPPSFFVGISLRRKASVDEFL